MMTKTNESGFTLLELLIALTIFSVGLLAVCMMAITVIQGNGLSKTLTTAVNLAQNKIDDLKVTSFVSIVNSTENNLDENGNLGSGFYNRNVVVQTNRIPSYKTVQVRVSWATPNPRSVTLQSIIAE